MYRCPAAARVATSGPRSAHQSLSSKRPPIGRPSRFTIVSGKRSGQEAPDKGSTIEKLVTKRSVRSRRVLLILVRHGRRRFLDHADADAHARTRIVRQPHGGVPPVVAIRDVVAANHFLPVVHGPASLYDLLAWR